MTRRRKSAAYRIAFAYSAAIAIGIALLGTIIFWAMHIAFTRQLDAMIEDEVQTLIIEYRSGGEAELRDAIAQRERLTQQGATLYYAEFEPNGRRVFGSLNTAMPALGMHDIAFVDPTEGADQARGLAVELPDHRRLLVAADREWVEQIDRTVLVTFTAGFLAVIGLGIVGALLLGGYLRKRLRAIGSAAEAIIGGDIRRRMPASGRGDEFDQLAGVLNAMLEEIERLLENLRQVSSDVAHDLRSPLSHLRNALEESTAGSAESREQVIADAIRRVDEILSLFAAILRISEIESGEIRRLFKPVELSALITDLAESYAPAVREGGRSLTWSIEPGLTMTGDRELIAQAVTNLLENALRHTPVGTEIHIDLASSAKNVRIAVADTGPGVADSDWSLITRRFIRLESSRSRAGHGLGLNLVAAIARLHQGQLSFADNAPGLVAQFDLPRS
ncbi:MAG TPA: HAMP domain-containing sensor histidine kinase [Sphingomicrobium sp.]|nr:HAMP domain-containing sensor histidine kinase [Sphingomicrobium sp.]